MPRLERVTSKELVAALHRPGFVDRHQKGSHRTLVHPDTGRRVTAPMHGRVLSTGMTHDLLRQAGLTADDLRKLLG